MDGESSEAPAYQIGQVSPDRRWYWDGSRWSSTTSPDNRWFWDGNTWRPMPAPTSRSVVAIIAIIAVAVSALIVTLGVVARNSRPPCLYPPSVSQGPAVGKVQLPTTPTAIAGGSDSVWVVSAEDGSLRQITRDGVQHAVFHVGQSPSAVVESFDCARGEHLWVARRKANDVVEIDGITGQVLQTIPVGNNPAALALWGLNDEGLWVANQGSGSISLIDTKAGVVLRTVSVGRSPRSLAVEAVDPDETVYVANHDDGTVSVVDGKKGLVTYTIEVGKAPSSVAYDIGFPAVFGDGIPAKLWVANADDQTVMKIDPGTHKVLRTWPVPGQPLSVIAIGVRAWVVVSNYGLVRIDDSPKQNLKGDATIYFSDPIAAIDADFSHGQDQFWVATARDRSLWLQWN